MLHRLRYLCVFLLLASAPLTFAQRQMEALGRGVVALVQPNGQVYVSWRLLGNDPDEITFNLYRASGSLSNTPVRLNTSPISTTTDFIDAQPNLTSTSYYFVRPVLKGSEQDASGAYALPAGTTARAYLSIPMTPPPGGTNSGGAYTYSQNDCSIGDLDGDGEYEIVVKWDPSNAKDNSQAGVTGNVYLDAYKLDGTRLWRIDLGRNIRAGAHYTQFMVYDLDGDGSAEVACKTADGTIDGAGVVIGNANADHRNADGYILTGPEFLTIFNGRTGAALATTGYLPARNNNPASADVSSWGDNYGNRVDRFLAAVAYLDGNRPSLVMCRGYYTRAVLVAWNWRNGQLTRQWTFDSDDGTAGNSAYRGQGNHNLSVADVDDDGRDEIIYGSAAIDDDGKGLHLSRLAHGDAMHVSDLDPERPGLEVWQCHEDVAHNGGIGLSFRDAKTGALIWSVPNTSDTGRAVAIDIDPRHPGYECWGAAGGLYNAKGAQLSTQRPSWMNSAIWWDGDLLREIQDGNRINKWNWTDGTETRLLTADGASSNNGTKANAALTADMIGDWREEMIVRATDNRELRIYTTTIPAMSRIYTLMHDPQYRLAIAWQNVAYNQPPHPGFFLGNGMTKPPTPLIRTVSAGVAATPSRLVNMSVLAPAGERDDTLIVGFGVAGGSRPFLVRGIGPTLAGFGVSDFVADPELKLFSSGNAVLGTNNNWEDGGPTIGATALSVGAFPLPPSSRDSALLSTLSFGGYSVHVSAAAGARGQALVELYAAGSNDACNLNNVSVRARVGSGGSTAPLITGFVVRGPSPRTVMVRAIGPQLALYGVSDALTDPRITLYRGDTKLAENDNWQRDSGAIASSFPMLGAFGLANNSKDSTILMNLPEGNYSVHTTSGNGGSGIVLVEVYTTAD